MEVCRLCLGLDLQISYTFSLLEGTYKDMVQVLLPELNLKLTKDPVICGTCLDNLQKLHHFKMTCLKTESKLTYFCGTHEITSSNQISLHSILELDDSEMDTDLEFAKVKSEVFDDENGRTPMKSANESKIVDAKLKQEEIYIKSELGTEPETELEMSDKTNKNLHGVFLDVSETDTDLQMAKVKSEVFEDESVETTMKYASRLEIIGDVKIKQEEMVEKSEPQPGTSHDTSHSEMEVCTLPELGEAATSASGDLLPEKSKKLYMNAYTHLKTWCEENRAIKITENVLLAYFKERADCKKVSTLWANYSMLKSTLAIKENIDISKFFELTAFLKQKNNAYKPKYSRVFAKEEINKFVIEAPDDEYLSKKAIAVIGVAGACRTDELYNMVLDDLDIQDDLIVINIPNSKNGTSRKFVIIEPQWINVVKKYVANRPTDIRKLFILYRGGRHIKQNIGHNTISKVPYVMAQYLKLQNPTCYSGRSLRRSSAENGGDLSTKLKKARRVEVGYGG